MKNAVLKVLSIALALSLLVSVSACGGAGSTGGSGSSGTATETPGVATEKPATEADTGSREIFAIEEANVKTQVRNNVMSYINVDGEDRDELLSVVADLKATKSIDLLRGIGVVTGSNVQTPGDGGKYNVNINIKGTEADYKTLTDYYRTFDGTVVFESDVSLVVDYEWGRLNSCRFSPDLSLIQVSFVIT